MEFEHRNLHLGEDPAVFKWKLENLLAKADPSLPADAKKALIARQHMTGLPRTLVITRLLMSLVVIGIAVLKVVIIKDILKCT